MDTEDQFDRTVSALYEALLSPVEWNAALRAIVEYVGANVAHYLYWDIQHNTGEFENSFSRGWGEVARDALIQYDAYYGSIDPRRHLVDARPVGEWLFCQNCFDRKFVEASEFYQDFPIPSGVSHVAGMKLTDGDGIGSYIGIMKAPGQPPFSEEQMQKLQRLGEHLLRAGKLHRRLLDLKLTANIGLGFFDALDFAAMIVSADGKVVHANKCAENFLQLNHTLTVQDGLLTSINPYETIALAQIIVNAADKRYGGALMLGTPKQQRCNVQALPLPVASPWNVDRATPLAMVLISEPGHKSLPLNQQLRRLYGLTRMEAGVAIDIADGKPLQTIAEEHDVAISTVRSQLRSVLAKTDVHRQAELVHLILSFPPFRDVQVDMIK